MKSELKGFLISTLVITLIGFGAQFGLGELLGKSIGFKSQSIIYLFLLIFNVLIHIGVLAVKKHDDEKTGMAILAGSVIKMLGALSFLLPTLMGPKEGVFIYVIHFFVAYGLYLIHEMILMLKLVKTPNPIKE